MVELSAAGGREKKTVASDAACIFLNTWTLEREREREREKEREKEREISSLYHK